MAEWRCRIDGRETGPLSDEQLRAKAAARELKPADEIFNPASGRWQPASRMRGLFAVQPPAPSLDDRGQPPAVRLVADDAGPFLKLAGSFAIARVTQWGGPVYASPTAFYLVKVNKVSMGRQFGLLGALVDAIDRADDIRSCRISELPQTPRGEMSWMAQDFDVIVLPKAAVRRVSTSWTGGLSILCGGDRFNITGSFFRRGKVRRFLNDSGWPLNEEMQVTSAPVHGSGVGRDEDHPGPVERPAWQRYAYAALVTLVVVVVIAAKVSRQMNAFGDTRPEPKPVPHIPYK